MAGSGRHGRHLFTVGEDTNELLVPFITQRNSRISREHINHEAFLRTAKTTADACVFVDDRRRNLETAAA